MLSRFPKPTHLNAFKWRGLFLFMLIVLVLASLIGVVRVQHEIRHLETQYYLSLKEALTAHEEWGRLQLEKKYLTAPARVEQVARTKLNMTSDKSNFQILYLYKKAPELAEIGHE
ncbi:MAG: cell division protein FtsL [Pseudomonadota bacterium]